MDKYYFSIIVPIFNVAKYLRKCINSIIEQPFNDYELILVDDGSTDGSGEICDEYCKAFANVKIVHKCNEGLVAARKTGVTTAQGEYVIFIDGDDWIDKQYISVIAHLAIKTNTDIIVSGYTKCHPNGRQEVFDSSIAEGLYDRETIERDIVPCMLSKGPFFSFGIYPNVCSKCIRRTLVAEKQEMIPNSIRIGEDAALIYPCILAANSIYASTNVGYMYRINAQSMTHRYDPKMGKRSNLLISYLKTALKSGESTQIDRQLEEYRFFLLNMVIIDELLAHRSAIKGLRCIKDVLYDSGVSEKMQAFMLKTRYRLLYIAIDKRNYLYINILKYRWKLKRFVFYMQDCYSNRKHHNKSANDNV